MTNCFVMLYMHELIDADYVTDICTDEDKGFSVAVVNVGQ